MKKLSTKTLVTIALLTAMSVILRLIGFPQTGTVRFELGFLPIAAAGYMYGGLYSGIAYVIADIIGTLLTGAAPLPTITLCKFIFGLLFGLFLYKKKNSVIRIFICVLTVTVIVDLILMPLALLALYGEGGIWAIFIDRLLMSAFNLPFRTVMIYLTFRYTKKVMDRHMEKEFEGYANSFQAKARLGLESITCLLNILGNPHKKVSCIHIAGTNGKGSVCAFLQSILTLSGKKTGKYISPEMVNIRERITIDSVMITQPELDEIMKEVMEGAEKVKKIQGQLPTQFEIWTAAAFLYFSRSGCDIAVIETGLGGMHDATNVIEKPLFSIITRIDMDHMNYLGDTLYQVACAKAGIIKEGCPVITLNQQPEAMRAITEAIQKKNSPVIYIGEAQNQTFENCREIFSYKGIDNISPAMAGVNQSENARFAIEAALAMGIDPDTIKEGIARAENKGRFELLRDNIIFDGAHNPNGMKSLKTNINRYFPDRKKTFICGFMGDKDLKGIFELLEEYHSSDFYAVTVQNNSRAMKAADIKKAAQPFGINMQVCRNVNEAIEKTAHNELVVICGSLYLYKDIDFKLF